MLLQGLESLHLLFQPPGNHVLEERLVPQGPIASSLRRLSYSTRYGQDPFLDFLLAQHSDTLEELVLGNRAPGAAVMLARATNLRLLESTNHIVEDMPLLAAHCPRIRYPLQTKMFCNFTKYSWTEDHADATKVNRFHISKF